MAKPMPRAQRWLGRATVIVATLIAATASLLLSYAAVAAGSAPEQVLRVWPSNDAKTDLAARLFQQANGGTPDPRAARLAEDALLHQPLSARAASTLALIAGAGSQPQRMIQLLNYSERLSRRDLPTQLALLEIQVQNGNVANALVHYDRALRTSPTAARILFPVLVAAINQPVVAQALAPILAARPDWWKAFTVQIIAAPDTVPSSSYELLSVLHLDVSRPDEHAMAEDAIQKIAAKGRVDLAARLYAKLRPDQPKPAAAIHDGGFRQTGSLSPFDWMLTDGADLSATVEARPDGKGNGLFFTATNGASGVVARQLLVTARGNDRLDFDLGDLTRTGPVITVAARCIGATSPLASIRPDPAASGAVPSVRHVTLSIAVPSGCNGLWIEFNAQEGTGMAATAPWIGNVAFGPVPRTF